MGSTDLAPEPSEGGSALGDFLSRSVVYEKAGAVIPRDLLQFGLYGSIVVIATGILALIIPSAESIRQGDFYLVLGGTAADIGALLHALAIPSIVCGLALLGLDLYLMEGRRSEYWRGAVVAWFLIVVVVTACCLALLAGLGSGS